MFSADEYTVQIKINHVNSLSQQYKLTLLCHIFLKIWTEKTAVRVAKNVHTCMLYCKEIGQI